MRVLVACEYSGRVRDAFKEEGHDAWSCDLLPTEVPGQHIEGDVFEAFAWGQWDLIVAHPPCTYLTNSGVRWMYGGKGDTLDPVRWANMQEGATFFAAMLAAPARYVVVENPVMHGMARDAVRAAYHGLTFGRDTEADFLRTTVQPWQHGEGETKATVLWTKGLPALVPTDIVSGRKPTVHFASPGPDRWKERSRTYRGIARAIATQYGRFIREEAAVATLRTAQVDRLALELDGLA